MSDVQPRCTTLQTHDGHTIQLQSYVPEGQCKAVIQILHGLGEYADRYQRFSAAAVERGFAVFVHDHRGHGKNAAEPGFFSEDDGWERLVEDALVVHENAREQFARLPIVLLGHSMGSYVAQSFAMHYGGRLSALILSASTWPARVELAFGYLLAHFECWRLGERRHSALLDKLGFGNFNKRFLPARTELDWLSRDTDEVDAYIADPLCGGPYMAGLWHELTRGLFSIASDNAINRVPSDLPILITGGEQDPVGGDRGLGKLALHYAQTGHQRMGVKIYPGGRHEMLNETNRDEVTRDWLDWIESQHLLLRAQRSDL